MTGFEPSVFSADSTTAYVLRITMQDGYTVTIGLNGQVTASQPERMDDVAKMFWNSIERMLRTSPLAAKVVEQEREIIRLKAEIAEMRTDNDQASLEINLHD